MQYEAGSYVGFFFKKKFSTLKTKTSADMKLWVPCLTQSLESRKKKNMTSPIIYGMQ